MGGETVAYNLSSKTPAVGVWAVKRVMGTWLMAGVC